MQNPGSSSNPWSTTQLDGEKPQNDEGVLMDIGLTSGPATLLPFDLYMQNPGPSSNLWSKTKLDGEQPQNDEGMEIDPTTGPATLLPLYPYDMQYPRPSFNPWSTTPLDGEEPQNDEGELIDIDHTSGPATLLPSDQYMQISEPSSNPRCNRDRLDAEPTERGPVLNSKSLLQGSTLHIDPHKPHILKLIEGLREPFVLTQAQVIDFGMQCCSLINPAMDGLQRVLAYSPPLREPIYIPKGNFVQILPIRGNHVVVASDLFSPDPSTVVIYDTKYRAYEQEQFEQISRLRRLIGDKMRVIFSPVQQQTPGSNLCGPFSIFHSIALCKGIEPELVVIKEETLRNVVADFLEAYSCGKKPELEFELKMDSSSPLLAEVYIELCGTCKKQCCKCG